MTLHFKFRFENKISAKYLRRLASTGYWGKKGLFRQLLSGLSFAQSQQQMEISKRRLRMFLIWMDWMTLGFVFVFVFVMLFLIGMDDTWCAEAIYDERQRSKAEA